MFQFIPVVTLSFEVDTEPLSFCKEKWWVGPPWKFLGAEDMLPMRCSLAGSRGPYQSEVPRGLRTVRQALG